MIQWEKNKKKDRLSAKKEKRKVKRAGRAKTAERKKKGEVGFTTWLKGNLRKLDSEKRHKRKESVRKRADSKRREGLAKERRLNADKGFAEWKKQKNREERKKK